MFLAINRYVPLSMLIASVVVWPVPSQAAQNKSMSAGDVAFYQGADREKIILEGAKKEGQVTFYTSNTWVAGPVSKEFEKKYPFVKANVWRSDSKELMKRLTEEVTAARFLADVVETSPEYITILMSNKMLQEYVSPELSAYDDEAKIKGKRGVYAWTNREIYISLGFNTKLIPPAEAPKRLGTISTPNGKERCRLPERAPESSGLEPLRRPWVASL
jgi:iron(III) transport system substrate-binding protein